MRAETAPIVERLDSDRDTAGGSLLDELMTAQQMAAVLQMRVSTIEDYARRGLLPSVKLGRHRRFVRSQVEGTISALCQNQLPMPSYEVSLPGGRDYRNVRRRSTPRAS